jgi:hypothetical protein
MTSTNPFRPLAEELRTVKLLEAQCRCKDSNAVMHRYDLHQPNKTSLESIQMKSKVINRRVTWKSAALAALAVAAMASTPAFAGDSDQEGNEIKFDLVPSKGLPAPLSEALKNAHGRVKIESVGPVEIMDVIVWGLPPNTDFDFFVIQVPNKPFGLAWYQGDIETNKEGKGYGRFIGRFSIESFIVSLASVPAPVVFHNAFPDAALGPVTGRIHTYHLGLWFNSPIDGAKAGAPVTTPFNGEGNAGVQVLNTGEFPDLAGPLIKVTGSGN